MVDENYSLEPVPVEKTVSGLRIAIVVIGVIIALPAFITGAEIGFALGFRDGVLSIFIGGIILSGIAMATGTVGARVRLNTAMIARLTFGSLGGKIVTFILALTCLGWFGVTAELFGRGVHQILADFGWAKLPAVAYIATGGLLMVVTTIFGFSALQRLSNITVPLLAILIAYTAFVTLQRSSPGALAVPGASGGGLDDGVSAIVGGLSVAVTIFPDFARFSRTVGAARLAAVLTYGVAMPVVLLLAMIPSIVTHQRDLMVIMTTLGLGVPALLLLIVKAWATNAGNLYSASLSAGNLLRSRHQKWTVVVAGSIGIVFAVAGISQQFIPFLIALGITIPPIAGIYIAEFLWVRTASDESYLIEAARPINWTAMACWALGIGVALLTRHDVLTLTGIAACDAMIVAAGAYGLVRRVFRPRGRVQTTPAEVGKKD